MALYHWRYTMVTAGRTGSNRIEEIAVSYVAAKATDSSTSWTIYRNQPIPGRYGHRVLRGATFSFWPESDIDLRNLRLTVTRLPIYE